MIRPFFGQSLTQLTLHAAIEGRSDRHKATVQNIANVDTPGYQRVEVQFEDQLKKAMRGFRPQRGSDSSPFGSSFDRFSTTAETDSRPPLRADGSNVSIDSEMAMLAKNSGELNALTELMIRQYTQIKSAINGR